MSGSRDCQTVRVAGCVGSTVPPLAKVPGVERAVYFGIATQVAEHSVPWLAVMVLHVVADGLTDGCPRTKPNDSLDAAWQLGPGAGMVWRRFLWHSMLIDVNSDDWTSVAPLSVSKSSVNSMHHDRRFCHGNEPPGARRRSSGSGWMPFDSVTPGYDCLRRVLWLDCADHLNSTCFDGLKSWTGDYDPDRWQSLLSNCG